MQHCHVPARAKLNSHPSSSRASTCCLQLSDSTKWPPTCSLRAQRRTTRLFIAGVVGFTSTQTWRLPLNPASGTWTTTRRLAHPSDTAQLASNAPCLRHQARPCRSSNCTRGSSWEWYYFRFSCSQTGSAWVPHDSARPQRC